MLYFSRPIMTNKPPVIILLMRHESPGYYSIERLFECIAPLLAKSFKVRAVRVPCPSSGLLRCVRNLIFTARLRADVIHVTGDIYYCALAIPRRRCVLTIHDLCSLNRLMGARKRVFSMFWYSLPIRWASRVTAISEETRKHLEFRFKAARGKVQLIPNCVDEAFGRNNRPVRDNIREPQLLQVGTGLNKNLERVALAVSGLPLHLRIIGPLTDDQRALLGSADLSWSSVERLSAEELVLEYKNSDALMFASTYEGFGLPIIEAQAIGLPVITSNMPPMNTVAGDAALFVDPYDESDIRSAVERLIHSFDLMRRLSHKGKLNAGQFGAKVVADLYADLYLRKT